VFTLWTSGDECGTSSPGRATLLFYTVNGCLSLGIYTDVILLSLLSFSVRMTVSPMARHEGRVHGRGRAGLPDGVDAACNGCARRV
jgi:hypothetical protein